MLQEMDLKEGETKKILIQGLYRAKMKQIMGVGTHKEAVI